MEHTGTRVDTALVEVLRSLSDKLRDLSEKFNALSGNVKALNEEQVGARAVIGAMADELVSTKKAFKDIESRVAAWELGKDHGEAKSIASEDIQDSIKQLVDEAKESSMNLVVDDRVHMLQYHMQNDFDKSKRIFLKELNDVLEINKNLPEFIA